MENIYNTKLSSKISDNKTIVFFVKEGLDSFLEDIILELSSEYLTKKIIVKNLEQIDEEMELADICWFEWCDELITYASKINFAKGKKIICRMHSYEAFTEYPANVAWENVDKIIFVAEHIKNFVVENFRIDEKKTIVIPNGIEEKNWTFAERSPGFNIAYVGYINYKKGPMLLLHAFKNIFDSDNKYKLFIAGKFQDQRDVLYFNQMIKEFGLENNVIYEGWQDNLDKWLEDKNYILCTSILESQNMSVMQAMVKGIKPIIHNFVGAKTIYPKALVWNTINEAVEMINHSEYNSKEYNSFVLNAFELHHQIKELKLLFANIIGNIENTIIDGPLVTIGITVYNGKEYLLKCVESFLNQTYKNIEILLVDDCSTDGSKEMIKGYEKKYEKVKAIYHSANSGGASKGIQQIITNAKGKYFQWIACDDFAERDAIAKFVAYLEENSTKDYVYSNINIVNKDNIIVNRWNYKSYTPNEVIEHVFKSASGVIPMNCLYRLSFFKDKKVDWIVYRDNDFSADTLNSLHFIKYNWNYGKIDDVLINYRIHSNNLSNNLKKRIHSAVSIFDYIIKNFEEGVYASQIQWDKFNDKQFKNYILAQFYYDQIQNHVNMNAIPDYVKGNVTKDQLKKYCYVFAEEGMKYIEEGLKDGLNFFNEIVKLKELYFKYMEEVKI